MSKTYINLAFLLFVYSCSDKAENVKPIMETITESVHASGIIKSENQYDAYATVNGIISNIYLTEGDSVKIGTPILSISNEVQRLNEENAELSAQFSDFGANRGKLNEASSLKDLSKHKMKLDSSLYFRQLILWKQQIGTKVELEQKEFSYENSKNAYMKSCINYDELKRQLDYTSIQSKKNLLISKKLKNDYTLKSEINGIVYGINKKKGEMVGLQTPLATVGDAHRFILEMQVDEYDILKIRKGEEVLVTLDSYKEKVFKARVTKINPLMNEQSKTFLIEAQFTEGPKVLYPNISFEANIIIQTKGKALLIPRSYLLNDSTVIKANGQLANIKTGLKDYEKIEIISGVNTSDELKLPAK
jgi:HlyD family secretion protein